MMQPLELDPGVFQRGYQEQGALFVLEKQVLGVAARNLPAQRTRLLNREQRRVFHGSVNDAESVKKCKQVGGRRGHCGVYGEPGRYWEGEEFPHRHSASQVAKRGGFCDMNAPLGITAAERMRV